MDYPAERGFACGVLNLHKRVLRKRVLHWHRVRTIRVDWGGPDRKGPAPIKAQCDRFLSFAPLRMLAIRVSCAAGGPNNASVATSSATVMTTSAFKTPPRKEKRTKITHESKIRRWRGI